LAGCREILWRPAVGGVRGQETRAQRAMETRAQRAMETRAQRGMAIVFTGHLVFGAARG